MIAGLRIESRCFGSGFQNVVVFGSGLQNWVVFEYGFNIKILNSSEIEIYCIKRIPSLNPGQKREKDLEKEINFRKNL